MQYFHVFHLYSEVFKMGFDLKHCSRKTGLKFLPRFPLAGGIRPSLL